MLVEIAGMAGAILCLFAFYRTSIGRWTGKSLWYELDNFLSGVLMGYYAYEKQAVASLVLNVIWVGVAIIGLSSIRERHPQLKKSTRSKSRR